MEAKPRLCLGLELEVVQILIKNALSDKGTGNFVQIRQAAIYALMYYITARFEEVKDLELRQICKKGASIEVLIYKGKKNQKRQLQRCVIHPNSLSYQGKTCPVAHLDDYLALCHSLGHNGEMISSFHWLVLNGQGLNLQISSQSVNLWNQYLTMSIPNT